jgi:chemotaxis protein MotB
MSLLLCFFILLAAFSEIKDDDFEVVKQAIREAFGQFPGQGYTPTSNVPMQSVMEQVLETALYKERIRKLSKAEDPGVVGRELTVTQIREGLKFTVGGLISFNPGSAELMPQARTQLQRVANTVRGQTNKVEIRGHAEPRDMEAASPSDSVWDLSYARARAAMTYLTRTEGIDPRRIRLIGCGDKEPLIGRTDRPEIQAVNRRIEIIVTESLMQEFDAAQQDRAISVAQVED